MSCIIITCGTLKVHWSLPVPLRRACAAWPALIKCQAARPGAGSAQAAHRSGTATTGYAKRLTAAQHGVSIQVGRFPHLPQGLVHGAQAVVGLQQQQQ